MNDPIITDTLLMLAICILGTGGILLLAYGIGGLLLAFWQAVLKLAKHVSV